MPEPPEGAAHLPARGARVRVFRPRSLALVIGIVMAAMPGDAVAKGERPASEPRAPAPRAAVNGPAPASLPKVGAGARAGLTAREGDDADDTDDDDDDDDDGALGPAPVVPLKKTPSQASAAARAPSPRRTTLDRDLQASATRILEATRAPAGAIVVSDVRTGRILAWVSKGAVDHVKTPIAPSASLFKVVTAATLLDRGRVRLDTKQCYAGGEHGITEADIAMATRPEACAPFSEALGRSLNLVIARLALRYLSPTDLHDTAAALGFFAPVPLDEPVPPNDVRIPTDPLGFARAAAGFWNGRLSPLGALFVMQTIANRGERIRLRAHDDGAGVARESFGQAIKPSTADALRTMLEKTTRIGTCAKVFREDDGRPALGGMGIAAKTGTLVGDSPPRMYSWFAGFAPSRAPRIALAVLLVDDVHWWMKANAAARRVLESYFSVPR